MNNRIYLNKINGYLYEVYDRSKDKQMKFGKLFKKYNDKNLHSTINETLFEFGDDRNLYSLSKYFPLLRKYDVRFKLIYEVDLSFLQEFKDSKHKIEILKNLNTMSEYFDNLKGNRITMVVIDISCDDDYLYLLFKNNIVYVLDKNTASIIKKIELSIKKMQDKFNELVIKIDAKSKDFIYAIQDPVFQVLKYEK